LRLLSWLQHRAAGVPLTARLEDVARLRRHTLRNWYEQLEARRRSVRLPPVRKKRRQIDSQTNHVHRME
jgi:hypothetical protein